MKEIEIFTDGACSGNPGPGGYGAVLKYGAHVRELSGGYKKTTNNRMEILAVIKALQALREPCRITLYSDSKYVLDALSLGWARKWRASGWMRNKKDKALNPDLWEVLLDEVSKHKIDYVWVKGHAGNAGNERCDALAVEAYTSGELEDDTGYGEQS